MKLTKYIIILVIFLLASCATNNADLSINREYPNRHITKWHDDEAGVTCWVLLVFNAGGISCIPDNQLNGN